jgi:hypothetical protein
MPQFPSGIGAEYYVESSITVIGSKKFVTVCCTMSGMQLGKVLGGGDLDTTGCKNRILKWLHRMWKVWGGSGCGLFQFITPARLKELKKARNKRCLSGLPVFQLKFKSSTTHE